MSELINAVVNVEIHQICNRGEKLPRGSDDFTAFNRPILLDVPAPTGVLW
jgi:hypothetical protein